MRIIIEYDANCEGEKNVTFSIANQTDDEAVEAHHKTYVIFFSYEILHL
jgi:hypothetical protein